LFKELERNVALRVEDTDSTDLPLRTPPEGFDVAPSFMADGVTDWLPVDHY